MTDCSRCKDTGMTDDGRLRLFCECSHGAKWRKSHNRIALDAYRKANMEPICRPTIRSVLLTTMSLMDKTSRKRLVQIAASHPGCESRIAVESELSLLIKQGLIGMDPDWDANSDADDTVYYVAASEAPLTKEQEAACKMQRARTHSPAGNYLLWTILIALIATALAVWLL